MTFDQSICWVFNCCESDLEPLFWRYPYRDLTGRLRLKVGEFTTSHLQAANGLVRVAAMVFGGGEKTEERVVTDVHEFNRMMSGG